MASSYSSQIPAITELMVRLKPKSVLDVGKGFGKYGFLLHEYCGIDNTHRPNAKARLLDQSNLTIDAVESNPDYLWPHIDHLYRQVLTGRIEALYSTLQRYDLVLMADVIEHLEKSAAIGILRYFLASGSVLVISSPLRFFQQVVFESPDETHLSHWTPADFTSLGNCDYQRIDDGMIYLLSTEPLDVRGFGHSPVKRLRRIARAFRNEIC